MPPNLADTKGQAETTPIKCPAATATAEVCCLCVREKHVERENRKCEVAAAAGAVFSHSNIGSLTPHSYLTHSSWQRRQQTEGNVAVLGMWRGTWSVKSSAHVSFTTKGRSSPFPPAVQFYHFQISDINPSESRMS